MLAKSFNNPDEIRTFEKGKVEILNLGNVVIGRATLEPGWSWSKYIKPLVNTNSLSNSSHIMHHIRKNES